MANVNIKPLGDRVLLEICENTEEMMGGILIPDSAKEKPQEYRVIALGTGKNDDNGNKIPFDVKEGDIVVNGQSEKAIQKKRGSAKSDGRSPFMPKMPSRNRNSAKGR